jgi:hypothetical protein
VTEEIYSEQPITGSRISGSPITGNIKKPDKFEFGY